MKTKKEIVEMFLTIGIGFCVVAGVIQIVTFIVESIK
jgi:hypothetical protein